MSRREAFTTGIGGAIVEHPDLEIDFGRQTSHGLTDMARADNQQRDARQNRQIGNALTAKRSGPLRQRNERLQDLRRNCGIRRLGNELACRIEEKSISRDQAVLRRESDGLCTPLSVLDAATEATVILSRSGERRCVSAPRNWIRKDAHAAAADEAVIPTVIIIKMEGQHLGPLAAGGQCTQGTLAHLGLDAAAAERAALSPIGEDQHGSSRLLRRRAARLDHGAENAGLS